MKGWRNRETVVQSMVSKISVSHHAGHDIQTRTWQRRKVALRNTLGDKSVIDLLPLGWLPACLTSEVFTVPGSAAYTVYLRSVQSEGAQKIESLL